MPKNVEAVLQSAGLITEITIPPLNLYHEVYNRQSKHRKKLFRFKNTGLYFTLLTKINCLGL